METRSVLLPLTLAQVLCFIFSNRYRSLAIAPPTPVAVLHAMRVMMQIARLSPDAAAALCRRAAPAAALAAARAASSEMLQATALAAAATVLSSVTRNGAVQAPKDVMGADGGSALAVIESMSGSGSLIVQVTCDV